jgi:hypothetical protein
LSAGACDGLCGLIEVLPDRGRVGAKYLCDDEEVFHGWRTAVMSNCYEKLISAR